MNLNVTVKPLPLPWPDTELRQIQVDFDYAGQQHTILSPIFNPNNQLAPYQVATLFHILSKEMLKILHEK